MKRYRTTITLVIEWDDSGCDDPSQWEWADLAGIAPDDTLAISASNTEEVKGDDV